GRRGRGEREQTGGDGQGERRSTQGRDTHGRTFHCGGPGRACHGCSAVPAASFASRTARDTPTVTGGRPPVITGTAAFEVPPGPGGGRRGVRPPLAPSRPGGGRKRRRGGASRRGSAVPGLWAPGWSPVPPGGGVTGPAGPPAPAAPGTRTVVKSTFPSAN